MSGSQIAVANTVESSAEEDEAPLSTIDDISESLTALEEILEPLLAKPLHETLQGLDSVESAKLEVSIAYVIQDLIWVYLKCKGIPPDSHPVSHELQRIKSYFGKIKEAENPSKRSLVVDQSAAQRFIRAALASAGKAAEEAEVEASVRPPRKVIEVPLQGMHKRFTYFEEQGKSTDSTAAGGSGKAREDSEDSEDDEELEMHDEPAGERRELDEGTSSGRPTPTGSRTPVEGGPESSVRPSKRPKMDAFAGWGDVSQPKKKKTKSKAREEGES